MNKKLVGMLTSKTTWAGIGAIVSAILLHLHQPNQMVTGILAGAGLIAAEDGF